MSYLELLGHHLPEVLRRGESMNKVGSQAGRGVRRGGPYAALGVWVTKEQEVFAYMWSIGVPFVVPRQGGTVGLASQRVLH